MDSKKRIYLDIHILQTVPPSCVNRDDTGSPKTARYGGVTRARVSSQAWKRAVRLMFRDMFPEDEIGVRTKQVIELVKEHITALKPDADEPEKLARKTLSNAIKKFDENISDIDTLFFLSLAQASALAELAVAGEKDKKAYKQALKDNPSVDIALFGRMVASDPSLNYDAAPRPGGQRRGGASGHYRIQLLHDVPLRDGRHPRAGRAPRRGRGRARRREFRAGLLPFDAYRKAEFFCKPHSAGGGLRNDTRRPARQSGGRV